MEGEPQKKKKKRAGRDRRRLTAADEAGLFRLVADRLGTAFTMSEAAAGWKVFNGVWPVPRDRVLRFVALGWLEYEPGTKCYLVTRKGRAVAGLPPG